MRKYLLLSWFYKTKAFNSLLKKSIHYKKPCEELLKLYSFHQKEIESLLMVLDSKKIAVLTCIDEGFPHYLKEVSPQIWVITCQGSAKL